jgi:hypothetical protein
MVRRLDQTQLRAELQLPEARSFMLAYLGLVRGRVRQVAGYRARSATAMSLLDLAINQHVLTYEVTTGGTRQQSIVDSIAAPRQTVRDGLSRLENGGLVVRDTAGGYHPTDLAGEIANALYRDDVRAVARLCEALATYRAALGRTVSVLFALALSADSLLLMQL